jgi:3-oxoacyl-[acyl-carrier protein] reductase
MNKTSNAFSGRIAVITGGARGFGKAFGQALAARGAA